MATRQNYLALFPTLSQAMDWEASCVSAMSEWIPASWLTDSPPPEYWSWLIDQHLLAEWDAAA